jgi:TPR repeat protein
MKLLLAAALFVTLSAQAQVGTSPRDLTKRIEPQVRRPAPAPAARPAGSAAGVAAPAQKAPLTAAQAEQQKAMDSIEEKKKLQWQLERAEKGSDPAQFALGMRYLEGKGVEKDLKKARKWLEASAKQGNAEARKALAEHPELPPLDPPKAATPAAKP